MASAVAVVVTYSMLRYSPVSSGLPLAVGYRSPDCHQMPSKLSYVSKARPSVTQPILKSSTFVAGPSMLMFSGL